MFRLPVVSRGRLEDCQRTLTRVLDDLETERRRYEMLVDRMIVLKKEGFVEPPSLPVVSDDPVVPGTVRQALDERLDRGTTDYTRSEEIAQKMMEDGVPEDQIIQAILDGQEIDFV